MVAVVAGNSGAGIARDIEDRLADKRNEAEALRAKIMQSRLEARQLRVQLGAVGVANPSFVPHGLRTGAGAGVCCEALHPELRSLLEWLAECVDFTRKVTFECGSDGAGVNVGGRRVLLQRMAAMPLGPGNSSKVQLSVPVELQAEITELIFKVRASSGKAGVADVAKLAEQWELLGAEMVSAATGQQEPAIFLVSRKESIQPARAIVIAQWPSVDFAGLAAASAFHPEKHFGRLSVANPREPESKPGPPRHCVSTGDRVGIRYRGRWFRGVLLRVDVASSIANVQCDADSPGVITAVAMASVWPEAELPEEAQEDPQEQAACPDHAQKQVQVFRHVRARTIG